jgi:uncharacterized protein YfdQ (DUF2303 family)
MPQITPDTETTVDEIDTASEAAAIAKIARDASPIVVHDLPDDDGQVLRSIVFDREGRHVVDFDHEANRDRPRTKCGIVEVHTPQALADYVHRHLDPDTATLWADVDTGVVTVVLNDHEQSTVDTREAGWADHQARLKLRPSPEWTAWSKIDGELVGQTALAEFLEEHIGDIVEPDGATMLEVAHTFHATTGATFKRAQSTHSGEIQLRYEEGVQASAGRAGETEIPREFTLRLRPFVGTDRVEVRGQFRYRLNNGALALGVRLLNLDDVVREAIDQVVDNVAGQLELVALHGTAPSPRR